MEKGIDFWIIHMSSCLSCSGHEFGERLLDSSSPPVRQKGTLLAGKIGNFYGATGRPGEAAREGFVLVTQGQTLSCLACANQFSIF